MQAIGWLLIGTVILAYLCAFLERYGHLLLVLTGEVLLAALTLALLVIIMRAVWSWFCRWWELRQIRVRTAQAIQRTNSHYEKSRAEMEQLARAYRLRKGINQ
ncbi:putative membrane protein [Candidatus Protofrankia californiensis]|uniref:Putative membrane protein n=1 Tax=Candidatus Protofrankia californiensis TaxID=1839754 RepID=A0A1C3P3V6_9ACTN|nr:putative membrane protein [Candidatus Protofrankia californiensis]